MSEEVGRLKLGYQIAEKGYADVLKEIQELNTKLERIRIAIYGEGDTIGLFERIRSLAVRVGFVLFVLTTAGAFLGRWLEKVVIK